jgi:hypothetical protein
MIPYTDTETILWMPGGDMKGATVLDIGHTPSHETYLAVTFGTAITLMG